MTLTAPTAGLSKVCFDIRSAGGTPTNIVFTQTGDTNGVTVAAPTAIAQHCVTIAGTPSLLTWISFSVDAGDVVWIENITYNP